MKHFRLLIAGVLIGTSPALGKDPHSIAPSEILSMDALPNAGELKLYFCAVGSHLCIERSTSCHGQCCNARVADSEGYGCSGNVYGIIPPGFHYAGWRCQMYGTPTSSSIKMEGDAGPEPSYIKQCTNRR